MKSVTLNIDVSVDLDANGVCSFVYIGDDVDSQIQIIETWEDIINRNIEYYTVAGHIKKHHKKEIKALRKGLKKALKYFDEMVDWYEYEK